jgi:hypothetical protein
VEVGAVHTISINWSPPVAEVRDGAPGATAGVAGTELLATLAFITLTAFMVIK